MENLDRLYSLCPFISMEILDKKNRKYSPSHFSIEMKGFFLHITPPTPPPHPPHFEMLLYSKIEYGFFYHIPKIQVHRTYFFFGKSTLFVCRNRPF